MMHNMVFSCRSCSTIINVMRCSYKSSSYPVQTQFLIMREIIILALLLSQSFSLDERNEVNVTVENKLENAEANAHFHKLERRAISHSKLI